MRSGRRKVSVMARLKVAGVVGRFQREIKQAGWGPNIFSKEEKAAFEELNKNKDIVVVPVDKGSATVVLDAEDYKSKALEVIGQPLLRRFCIVWGRKLKITSMGFFGASSSRKW